MSQSPVSILFVCLGNICRSPTAQGVAEQLIAEQGWANKISVDSAGTAAYHVGAGPDSRSCTAAARRGIDLTSQRARQVHPHDFDKFDYIVAMDANNFSDLRRHWPVGSRAWLGQLRDPAGKPLDIPDPYYGGADGFEAVLDLLQQSIADLLPWVLTRHNQSH